MAVELTPFQKDATERIMSLLRLHSVPMLQHDVIVSDPPWELEPVTLVRIHAGDVAIYLYGHEATLTTETDDIRLENDDYAGDNELLDVLIVALQQVLERGTKA